MTKTKIKLTALLGTMILLFYAAGLILNNYRSQIQLQNSSMTQLQQSLENEAMVLSFFFSERKAELAVLSKSSVISSYYENLALGMSYEYGLRFSLGRISGLFADFIKENQIGDKKIYSRIVLMDKEGSLLADSDPEGTILVADWRKKHFQKSSEPDQALCYDRQSGKILISIPYFFKGGYAGHILVWLNLQTPYFHFPSFQAETTGEIKALVSDDPEQFFMMADNRPWAVSFIKRNFNRIKCCSFLGFRTEGEQRRMQDIFVIKIPVQKTPFHMITLLPSTYVIGKKSPFQLLVAMGLITLFVFVVAGLLWRGNYQNFVLQTNIKATENRKQEAEAANVRLQKEVAEREQVEKALRESKEGWEKTFDAISDIVTLLDPDMKIIKINQTGSDSLGLTYDKIIGQHCYEIFHGSSNEPCTECPVLVTRDSLEPCSKEVNYEQLDSLFLVSVFPVVNRDGKLTQLVHVAKDIAEEKQIKERLFLNEKLSTIAGLAAGVSHEINTPLSAILQALQIIELELDPDAPANRKVAEECGVDLANVATYFEKKEINYFLTGMRDSAVKSANIIKSLLEFSRPLKGDIIDTNLPDLLATTLSLAHSDYELRKKYDIINVEIVEEYDPELTAVPCVAMEIEQVFLNLIKNAVHAMADADSKKPCITIRASRMHGMAHVEVEDNGPGIDKEVRLHIFDPFFTTKEVGVGTGLGLSVSHSIVVDKHLGNIWVESEPGKGAKFIVELPLSRLG